MEAAALSVALTKAAAAAAANSVGRYLQGRVGRWKVAAAAARRAGDRGIIVRAATLRQWLARGDVQEQLRAGTAASTARTVESLAWVLTGPEPDRQRDAQVLLYLVLDAFLRHQDPAAAVAVAHMWQSEQIEAEAQRTRTAIDEVGHSIIERLDDRGAFDEHLRRLHPWRREVPRALRGDWLETETVVRSVVSADDRGVLLRQWTEHPPDWFEGAPPEALCWLGDLASDHAQPLAAGWFLGQAVDRGAYPHDYWQARRAMKVAEANADEATLLLDTLNDWHPFVRGVRAWHREAWTEAAEAITQWTPKSSPDLALRLQMLAGLSAACGDLNGAVRFALQASEVEHATGAEILAAELLLSRAKFGETVNRLADAGQAVALAVRARNARRTWDGDSVAAALVAVKAAALSGDSERAWRLTQPPPQGEATQNEATDPRLAREAAVLGAHTRRFQQARAAAQVAADEFTDAEVRAIELALGGNTTDAIAAWQEAVAAATDDAQMLAAAMALADLGGPLPDLEPLAETHHEAVKEIRTIHQALSGAGDDLESLRAAASQSVIVTIKLAERHTDRGEHRVAADVLKAGAERWTDPRLMLMAAHRYRAAGDLDTAREATESSLTLGGTQWAGQFEAHALLLELHDAAGDWDKVTEQARALVTIDPHDGDARWALVHSLVRRGDLPAAWQALTFDGEPLAPRDRHDAFAWAVLASKYDTAPDLVRRFLATMQRWPDDAELNGVFLGYLYTGLQREGLTPTADDLAALHAATDEYTERFPDSTTFRAITVSDTDPLQQLADELRKRHDAFEPAFAEVSAGRLPLGFLSEVTGHSYAEAALRRAAGFVRAHDVATEPRGREAAMAALDSPVVIDATAAHTLTLLDLGTTATLLGAFAQVRSTDATYRDAARAEETLSLRSTLSAGWDPVAERPTVNTIDESAAKDLARRAEKLCDVLRGTHRMAWPKLVSLDQLESDSEWLSPLDMSLTEGLPFWCDDAVLRRLAAQLGVRTFGTVDLLRTLASANRVDQDVHTVVEATLVANYYADLGFDRAMFEFAATMDEWRPAGTAFAVTRPGAWTDPAAVVEFVLTAVSKRANDSLQDIANWTAAAAIGLVRVAPDESSAGTNLRVLLARCLAGRWMRPDRLAVVLDGVRAGRDERPDIPDPLEPVVRATYASLVQEHGHTLAASLLIGLFRHASEADRITVARAVLTHTD